MISDAKIIRKVESIRPNTLESLHEYQKAKVPTRLDISWKRVFTYWENGIEFTFDLRKDLVFRISNIRYYNQSPKKAKMRFVKPLKELIENRELQPLMFFVNGVFIKWSKITVYYEFNKIQYYIKDIPELTGVAITSVEVFNLPFKVYYSENGSMAVDDIWYPFIFDENGHRVTDHSINYTYIGTTDTHLSLVGTYQLEECDHIPIGITNAIKLFPENIIVFDSNGNLYDVPIDVDRNILTINNGIADTYNVIIFYKQSPNDSLDNITRLASGEDDILSDLATSLKDGTTLPSWETAITKEFKLLKNTDPETYYRAAVEYMMEYNPNIFNDIYEQSADVFSIYYLGKELIDAKDNNGFFVIPRRHVRHKDDYIMVFVNGLLHSYNRAMIYENNKVKIPVIGINEQDAVEILFFRNIENKVLNGFIHINEDRTFLDPDLFTDDLQIFATEFETSEYNYPAGGSQVFPVPYVIEDMGNNEYRIRFTSNFYYDKNCFFVSKKQFRSNSFVATVDKSYRFKLSDDFRFCNDKNHYMVFLNGRLVNTSFYELTLYGSDVPYDLQFIYMIKPLEIGDVLDVFYVPNNFFLEKTDVVPDDGIISLTNSKEMYPFSPDLFMIFINGRKIPTKHKISTPTGIIEEAYDLQEYDTQRIALTTDPNSKLNMKIFSYIPIIPTLAEILKTASPIFDTFVSNLANTDLIKLYQLLGYTPSTITNTEADINDGKLDREVIFREIIRDNFTADRGVAQPTGFRENFTNRDEIFNGEDIEGVSITKAGDATLEDNLSIVRDLPTFEELPDPKDRPLKGPIERPVVPEETPTT